MSECRNCASSVSVDVETRLCSTCEYMCEVPEPPELSAGVLSSVEDEDDYKPLYSDDDDDEDLDVEGQGPRPDEPTKKAKVWEPLPPYAGINPQGRQIYMGHGKPWLTIPGPPVPRGLKDAEAVDPLTEQMRRYIAGLPKSPKARAVLDPL